MHFFLFLRKKLQISEVVPNNCEVFIRNIMSQNAFLLLILIIDAVAAVAAVDEDDVVVV
jgi:hypothetical protein